MNSFMMTAYATVANESEEAVSGVRTMAQLISEYGPLVVLLSIFFLIFVALIAIVLKSNNKMMKQIMNRNNLNGNLEGEIITKFVDGALKELTKDDGDIKTAVKNTIKEVQEENKKEKDSYHSDLIASYIGTNVIFKDASRAAMRELKCDRVAVYVFHNGNTSSLGLPFFKTSCVHDWTSIGASTMRGKTHVDVPLNAFDDIVESLWRYGIYKSENVHQTANDDRAIDNFIAGSRTEAMYAMVIKDDDSGAITGFVVAEFDKVDDFEHNETRDTEIKTVLSNMIIKVATIVNNKANTHKDK